jgi:hypothetical protein
MRFETPSAKAAARSANRPTAPGDVVDPLPVEGTGLPRLGPYPQVNRNRSGDAPLLIEGVTALAADYLESLAWKGSRLGSETRQVSLRLGF